MGRTRRNSRTFVKLTLVTGASGFLGWHVARLLTERGTGCGLCAARQARCVNWMSSGYPAICAIPIRWKRGARMRTGVPCGGGLSALVKTSR